MEVAGGLLPLGGLLTGAQKLGDIKYIGKYLGNFFYYFYFVVLFFIIILFILGFIRLVKFLYRRKLKKALILLHRLDTELLLIKNIANIKDDKKLEMDLSSRESVTKLKKMMDTRFFVNALGLHNCKRMIDGLEMIKEKSINIDIQLALVTNWIELVKSMLC
ncbi:hypothetical protein GF322_02455 [Candidatus Dependentiae bacterium]|nr:hypothetical protein [Candidatus Dependentiae bacterium]